MDDISNYILVQLPDKVDCFLKRGVLPHFFVVFWSIRRFDIYREIHNLKWHNLKWHFLYIEKYII